MLDLKILLALNDFKDLDDVALIEVAEHAKLDDLQQGERIVAHKMAKQTLYLLDGMIEVQTTGGVHQTIKAETERAQNPVFLVDTSGHYGRCQTACKILSVQRSIIEKFGIKHNRESNDLNYGEFDTVPANNASLVLMNEITELFKSKSISLPSIPEVALYINAAVDKEGMNRKKLAKIIQIDPVIAARVIHVANSGVTDSNEKYDSIRSAIERIGVSGVRTIVNGVVLRDLFMPGTELIVKRLNKFYEHSIRVGVICYELAKRLPGFDKDHAFLTGVLHDIGVIPVLVVADRHAEIAYKASNLDSVLAQLKSPIGSIVIQQWGFADEFVDIAKHAYDWDRQVSKAGYCDVVQVALMHSHLVGGEQINGPAICDLPAYKRLGMDKLNPIANIQILQELEKRIKILVSRICR